MLYISKKIIDNLPDDIVAKVSAMSEQRQTLFECYYSRFDEENLKSRIVLNALMEHVINFQFLNGKD